MDSSHILCGMAQPHDPYLAQSYSVSQPGEPIIDLSNMHGNIDPLLENALPATSTFVPGVLVHAHHQQVQRFLDDREKTAIFNSSPALSPQLQPQHHFQHHPVLSSTFQIPYQQQRWGSPVSSPDYVSSVSSALTPAADGELLYETGPATPPAAVDFTAAPHHHHFKHPPAGTQTPPQSFWGSPPPPASNDYMTATCMSGGYVDPSEINPASQAEFGGLYANSIHTSYNFKLAQGNNSLQDTPSPGFGYSINRSPTPAESFPAFIKQEASATDAYQPLSPLDQDAVALDFERPASLKRGMAQDEDEDDEDGDDSSDFAPRTRPTRSCNTRSRAAVPPKKQQALRRQPKATTQPRERPPSPKRQRKQSSQIEVAFNSPTPSPAALTASPTAAAVMLAQASQGHLTCRDCPQSTSFKTEGAFENHVKKQHKRPFVCVFAFAGCESTFASKNEWKRHVVSQHILLHFWVCTQDDCAKTVNVPPVLPAFPDSTGDAAKAAASSFAPVRAASSSLRGRNSPAIAPACSLAAAGGVMGHQHAFGPPLPNGAIFNRKDLFTQHVRRMHAPDKIRQHKHSGVSSSPSAVPATSYRRKSSSSGSATAVAAAVDEGDAAAWEQRVKDMQCEAETERCQLPRYMVCPAPGCMAVFEGGNAWDERMEHLAKHLEAAARGDEPAVRLTGGPGAEPDRSLIDWASRPDVAIIVQCIDADGPGQQWVLNNPLKPSGAAVKAAAAVATAAAAAAAAAAATTSSVHVQGGSLALGEIIAERGDEDAEGEMDDDY